MSDCECMATCPFFNDKMQDRPALTNLYKRNYCRGDNSSCGRYMIFKALGKSAVPNNLFPNMTKEAHEILVNAGMI